MSSVADEPRDGVKLIEIDQGQLQGHVDGVVREAVEQTLIGVNAVCVRWIASLTAVV